MKNKMYQFDNLIEFLKNTQALKCRRYFNWQDSAAERQNKRDNLELKLWVLTPAAMKEADNNHEILMQRCRAEGFTHMVYCRYGMQFLMPGQVSEQELEERLTRVLDEQYFDAINRAVNLWGGDKNYHKVDRLFRFSVNDEGSMVMLREWVVGAHNVPARAGLIDTKTGQRIKGRQNILKTFWDLGFLTLRARILQAATKDFGSKPDVLAKNEIRNTIDKLPGSSQVRKCLISGLRKLHRDCDWPSGAGSQAD